MRKERKMPGTHVQTKLTEVQRRILWEISQKNDGDRYDRILKQSMIERAKREGINIEGSGYE